MINDENQVRGSPGQTPEISSAATHRGFGFPSSASSRSSSPHREERTREEVQPRQGNCCGRAVRSVYRGATGLVGTVARGMYNIASYPIPPGVKDVYNPAYLAGNEKLDRTAKTAGKTLAATVTAGLAYGTFCLGTKIVDSSVYITQAIPGLATQVSKFIFADPAKVEVEAIIRIPSLLREVPFVHSFGHGVVALSAVIAAATLVAHCSARHAKATATEVGRLVAGAIAIHASQAVCEKVMSMPTFAGVTAGYKVLKIASGASEGTTRTVINILTTASIGLLGFAAVSYRATIFAAAVEGTSVLAPAFMTAVTAGTVALYGARAIFRRTEGCRTATRAIPTIVALAAISYGASVALPMAAGFVAQNAVLLSGSGWFMDQSIVAVGGMATLAAAYKTYQFTASKTDNYSKGVLASGVAVAAGVAVSFAAAYIDTYSPVSITGLFFVYQCSKMGQAVGSKVGSTLESGRRAGLRFSTSSPIRALVGLSAVIGHYTTAHRLDEDELALQPERPVVAGPGSAQPPNSDEDESEDESGSDRETT